MIYGIWVSRTPDNRWIIEGWCKPWGKLISGSLDEVQAWIDNAWKIPGVNYEVREYK